MKYRFNILIEVNAANRKEFLDKSDKNPRNGKLEINELGEFFEKYVDPTDKKNKPE